MTATATVTWCRVGRGHTAHAVRPNYHDPTRLSLIASCGTAAQPAPAAAGWTTWTPTHDLRRCRRCVKTLAQDGEIT